MKRNIFITLLMLMNGPYLLAGNLLTDAYYYNKNKRLRIMMKKEINNAILNFNKIEQQNLPNKSTELWFLHTVKYRITPYISFKIPFVSFKLAPFIRFVWVKNPPSDMQESRPN